VDAEHAACGVVVLVGQRDAVRDRDALDDQDAVLDLDIPDRLGLVAVRVDFDSARLQRARVRAGQSAAGGGHHVVERGGARRDVPRRNPVVHGDLVVYAEGDGLLLGRKVGETLRAALARDPDAGDVGGLGHGVWLPVCDDANALSTSS